MSSEGARYVPAAGRRVFTRLYDPVIALTMREATFRGQLLARVLGALGDGRVAVDVGCGTGTFAIELARERPATTVIGFDGDPEILEIARAKEGAEHVEWREGLAGELPLDDGSADAVIMSLLLHHLAPEAKSAALADAARILRPGGTLHIADWGPATDPLARAGFLVLQVIDGFEGTRDHAGGRLPGIVEAAGFDEVERFGAVRTAWGTLELLSAVRP